MSISELTEVSEALEKEILKIVESSYANDKLEFFFINVSYDEIYKSKKEILLKKYKYLRRISDIVQCENFDFGTKCAIWILFFNFLFKYHQNDKILYVYNTIYDKLSIIYYHLNMEIQNTSIIIKTNFFRRWAELICAVYLHIMSSEFNEYGMRGFRGFVSRTEFIIQELIIGFFSDVGDFHKGVRLLFEEIDYFEPFVQKPKTIYEKRLNLINETREYCFKKKLDRKRVLFSTEDISPLLRRAFELRGSRVQNHSSTDFAVKYVSSTVLRDKFIRAETISDRVKEMKRNHARQVNVSLKKIYQGEVKIRTNKSETIEKLNKVLSSKDEIKLWEEKLYQMHSKDNYF